MKIKLLSILAAMISIVFLSSCSSNKSISNKPKDESIDISDDTKLDIPSNVPREYTDVLIDYKKILDFRFSDNFEEDYNNGKTVELNEKLQKDLKKQSREFNLEYKWHNMLVEIDSWLEKEGTPEMFGYILKDINDDGIDELFWVDEKNNILAMFTIVNGESELLDAFWPRYEAIITDLGELYTRGSGGASYVYYEIKTLKPNSSEFDVVVEFAVDGYAYATNTVNHYEIKNGEKISITEERFDELLLQYPFNSSSNWLATPKQTI